MSSLKWGHYPQLGRQLLWSVLRIAWGNRFFVINLGIILPKKCEILLMFLDILNYLKLCL